MTTRLCRAVLVLSLAVPSLVLAQTLNEIRTDEQTAANPNEYVEIAGAPALPLVGTTLIVIGDGNGAAGSGVIETVVALSGSVPTDGHFLLAESTLAIGTAVADQTATLNFENDDTVTFMLVTGFTGTNGQDLDTNDDGTLEVQPWIAVLDSVSLVARPATEFPYSTTRIGPTAQPDPNVSHIERCPTLTGSWLLAPFDVAAGSDSPGAANPCPTTDAGVADAGFDAGVGDAGSDDAGASFDAGTDAGSDAGEVADAGDLPDAGEELDAGEEDAGELADAGEDVDAGFTDGDAVGGGCNCGVAPLLQIVLLIGLAGILRRRRA